MGRGNLSRVSTGVYVVRTADRVIDWLSHSWAGGYSNFHIRRGYRARATHLHSSKLAQSNPTNCREET